MTEALRYNSNKPKLSYFMRSFRWMTEAVARVKEFGANKYDEGNWRLGNKPDEEYLDSMFRHLDYFFAGEFYDEDSGCSHLAHAVWNLSALAELNYDDFPTMDEKVFYERMAYWAEKKAEKEKKRTKKMNASAGPHKGTFIGLDMGAAAIAVAAGAKAGLMTAVEAEEAGKIEAEVAGGWIGGFDKRSVK